VRPITRSSFPITRSSCTAGIAVGLQNRAAEQDGGRIVRFVPSPGRHRFDRIFEVRK
jgi:hypothetical protein